MFWRKPLFIYAVVFNYKGLERVKKCVFRKNGKKNEFFSQKTSISKHQTWFSEKVRVFNM